MSLASPCAKRFQGSISNFSIDHILNVAGGKQNFKNFEMSKPIAAEGKKFEWLNCTRYKPPKLPRQGRKEGTQRRKMGRNPRIPFSSSQVAFLEAKFLRTPYLSSSDVANLAAYLKLSEARNRRARERREKEIKSKGEENSPKPERKINSFQPSDTLSFGLPKHFPLDCSNSLKHLTSSQSVNNYFQILTPLDLSEGQMVSRPK